MCPSESPHETLHDLRRDLEVYAASPRCTRSLPSVSRSMTRHCPACGPAPLISLYSVPKALSSDTGNLDMSQRSHKVLPAREKVDILNLIRKKSCAEVRTQLRTNVFMQLRRKTNNFMLVSLSHLKLQKLGPRSVTKCSVKMKKTLNAWVADMNQKVFNRPSNNIALFNLL